MKRKRIPFNNSMRSDKRDDRFAYWRQNALSALTPGLYPSKDYINKKILAKSSYYELEDVTETLDGYDTLMFTSGTSSNTWYFWNYSNMSTYIGSVNARLCGVVAGGDGIYTVHNDLGGHSVVGKATTSGWSAIDTFPTNEINNNTIGIWDSESSLYWWINQNGIWKQTIAGTPVKVHNSIGTYIQGACIYQGYIVLLATKSGSNSFSVLFWDKATGDVDLFDRKVDVINASPFGIANLSGKLTVIYAIGNTRNQKEFFGEMVVGQFDGYKFATINKWFSNTYRPIEYSHGTCGMSYGIGSDVMIIPCVTVSLKPSILTQGTFIKINSDGEVVVEKSFPKEGGYNITYPYKCRVLFSKNILIYQDSTNNYVADNLESFNDYTFDNYTNYTTTEYITNFLENPYDVKKLNAFSFTFEKLFKNTAGSGGAEEVSIYYRTSDREDFTLLGTITAQNVIDYTNKEAEMTGSVPVPQQRYDISQMPDGSALPNFNEIQFYFKIKNGMSIIDAFYEYEELTHTTFN